jgi:hypothetical protein
VTSAGFRARTVIPLDYVATTMSAVWNALDNREKALLFWAAVLVAIGLTTRTGRDFLRSTLGIARGSLSAILVLYALYVAAVVLLLAWAGLWMTAVASATALWFAGPGMVMFLKANEALTNPHHLRDLVRRALWLLLGVEFVVNFFPLPLWAEILLLPFLTTIALFGVLPRDAEGAAGAKKFSEIVLGAFFVFLVVRFVVRVATDFDAFASSATLARFWVPPALTLAVLPFFYLLGLCMAYAQALLRLRFFMEGEPLLGYAKRAFFGRFGLNLGALREVGSGPLQVKVARAASRQEIDAILRGARRPPRWKGPWKPATADTAKTDAPDAARTAKDSG